MAELWLQKLMDESSAKDSPEDIVKHFEFIIEEKLHIEETTAVASAIHAALVEQLANVTDPRRLTVARKARTRSRKSKQRTKSGMWSLRSRRVEASRRETFLPEYPEAGDSEVLSRRDRSLPRRSTKRTETSAPGDTMTTFRTSRRKAFLEAQKKDQYERVRGDTPMVSVRT